MPREFPMDQEGFNPFTDLIGLEFTGLEEGSSTCRLAADGRHMNPHGVIHGGVMYTMADTGMGAAVYTILEREELCTTLEVKISYLRPARKSELVCVTRVIGRSKKLAFLESEVSCEGELVAKASGTYYIFAQG